MPWVRQVFAGAQFPDKQEDIARFRQFTDCRAEVLGLFRALSFKIKCVHSNFL